MSLVITFRLHGPVWNIPEAKYVLLTISHMEAHSVSPSLIYDVHFDHPVMCCLVSPPIGIIFPVLTNKQFVGRYFKTCKYIDLDQTPFLVLTITDYSYMNQSLPQWLQVILC